MARGADPGAAVKLDPHDEQHWQALMIYAAWKVAMSAFGLDRRVSDGRHG